MSVQIFERRYCDVCERDYEPDKPDWMILSAPNAPDDVEAAWDFCSYACLVTWVSTDEVDDAGPDFGPEHDAALAMGQTEQRQPAFHVEQPDGTPPPPAEVRRVHPGEPTREQAQAQAQAQAEAQAKLDAAMAEMRKSEDARPPMTLMEAIASGKLPFDRDPQ